MCISDFFPRQLHWLPVRHSIKYKLAVMRYKIHSTGLPAYLSHHINPRDTTRTLRSSDTLLFIVPFTRTELAKRAFRCAAPSVWNLLPSFIINSGSLTTFKSRLKTYFFRLSFNCSVHVWPHHIPASAFEVMTLWCYINQFIIIHYYYNRPTCVYACTYVYVCRKGGGCDSDMYSFDCHRLFSNCDCLVCHRI